MQDNKAFNYGVWLLSKRDYTEKQIKEKIVQKNYSQEEAEVAVSVLKDYGYINDVSYARKYITTAISIKKHGLSRIKNDLYHKGISREIIDELFFEYEDLEEKETLLPLVRKKINGDFDIKNINKVKRYFFSRGYTPSDISECIRAVRIEEDEKDE